MWQCYPENTSGMPIVWHANSLANSRDGIQTPDAISELYVECSFYLHSLMTTTTVPKCVRPKRQLLRRCKGDRVYECGWAQSHSYTYTYIKQTTVEATDAPLEASIS